MDEQLIIDILYFFLHDVFQWLSYFAVLTFMLTPKYNKSYIVLIPFAIAFCKPIYALLNSKYASPFVLFGLMIITVLTVFKEKKLICLAAMAASQLALAVMSMVCSLVIHNILGYYPTEIHPYTWVTIIYTIVLDILLWIVFSGLILIWNKLLKKKSVKSLGYFWLFPVGQVIFLWACMFRAWDEMEQYLLTNPYLILAVAVSLGSDILMYRALKENSHVQDMKQTISQMEKEMELQLKYYDALAYQYTEIREYKHDIRNLIASVKALSLTDNSTEERNELLNEMEEKADGMSIPMYCSDSLVNAVLWQKSAEAKKKDVDFSVHMNISERFGLERIDTCSLLVNILDNAIDEATKSEKGGVSLKVSRKAGLLFIDVVNNTDRIIMPKSESPKSGKTGDHGHGIAIIEKIAEKYNGSFVLSADGKTAHSVVSLSDR